MFLDFVFQSHSSHENYEYLGIDKMIGRKYTKKDKNQMDKEQVSFIHPPSACLNCCGEQYFSAKGCGEAD